MINGKTKFILCASLVLIALQCTVKKTFAQPKSTGSGNSKMFAQLEIMNNYVDRGLTQSQENTAVGLNLGYNFSGLGRIGATVHTVSYEEDSATIETSLYGEFKFVFTPNADLRIRNELFRYFFNDIRNRSMVLLDQNFFDYHFLFSREDNFEGLKVSRNWFAFQKAWQMSANFQILTSIGYSAVPDYDSFFDARLGFNYLMNNTLFTLAGTYVTPKGPFENKAGPFVIAGLEIRF